MADPSMHQILTLVNPQGFSERDQAMVWCPRNIVILKRRLARFALMVPGIGLQLSAFFSPFPIAFYLGVDGLLLAVLALLCLVRRWAPLRPGKELSHGEPTTFVADETGLALISSTNKVSALWTEVVGWYQPAIQMRATIYFDSRPAVTVNLLGLSSSDRQRLLGVLSARADLIPVRCSGDFFSGHKYYHVRRGYRLMAGGFVRDSVGQG
jgi:hypothetical protein